MKCICLDDLNNIIYRINKIQKMYLFDINSTKKLYYNKTHYKCVHCRTVYFLFFNIEEIIYKKYDDKNNKYICRNSKNVIEQIRNQIADELYIH